MLPFSPATLPGLAGGLGSRYRSRKPFDSLVVHGETIVGVSVGDALAAGFHNFVFLSCKAALVKFIDREVGRQPYPNGL